MSDISEAALAKGLAKVRAIIPHAADRVHAMRCDVSKESEVQTLIESQDEYGGIDIMFNNAGIMHMDDSDAIETSEKVWDLTQSINVKGVWFGSKHAVLSMRRHHKTRGSIINVASVVALVGSATAQLAYTASKGAVLAMTRELAMVHAREGIRFNALCPAPLNTPLLQDWLGDDKEKRHRREVHFPVGRFGEAIEQAQGVLFLASDESSFVNGMDFVIDGGMCKFSLPFNHVFCGLLGWNPCLCPVEPNQNVLTCSRSQQRNATSHPKARPPRRRRTSLDDDDSVRRPGRSLRTEYHGCERRSTTGYRLCVMHNGAGSTRRYGDLVESRRRSLFAEGFALLSPTGNIELSQTSSAR